MERKYYETLKPEGWDELRNTSMGQIFGGFIDSKDQVIRKNLANLFKTQISVSENDLWYAASAGRDIKLIPGEEKFKRGFTFENPNETARCGCGESFTTS